MTNEITRYQPDNLEDIQRVARIAEASGYYTDGTRGDALAQLASKIMAGQELGYTAFASIQGIHIIKGKPTISANLMAAAVKAHPRYDYRVRKMGDTECIVEFFEMSLDGKKWESIGESKFTAADAKKAGTQNMQKFPRNMLFARAISNGVRWFCPDVFSGNTVYTPDELGAEVDDDGEYVDVQATPTPAQPEPDNPFEDDDESPQVEGITQKQLKALHAVGTAYYGDDWNDKRHELASVISEKRTKSSAELTKAEASRLIDGIQRNINAAPEPAPLPEPQDDGPTMEEMQNMEEIPF